MHRVERLSEDHFVAAFLAGELDSDRFGASLRGLLKERALSPALLSTPDLGDPEACDERRELLGLHRGFGTDTDLFEGFPHDVAWSRWRVTRSDLWTVRYVNYSYWIEISGGSRLPTDAAERIRDGVTAFDVPNAGFLSAAQALRDGCTFPELILVRCGPGSPAVVLEGHLRLTAYALEPEHTPETLDVLIGESPSLKGWLD